MHEPTCRITVSFFARDSEPPQFTYFCISHPPTWMVSPEGVICPSVRDRIIRFELASDPAGAEFCGFRVATEPHLLRETHDPYLNDPARTHVKVIPATSDDATITMIEDLHVESPTRLWYSLGVVLDGIETWDDPKVYNPPGGG